MNELDKSFESLIAVTKSAKFSSHYLGGALEGHGCVWGKKSVIPLGFPGGASGKEPACQCRKHERCGFDP